LSHVISRTAAGYLKRWSCASATWAQTAHRRRVPKELDSPTRSVYPFVFIVKEQNQTMGFLERNLQ